MTTEQLPDRKLVIQRRLISGSGDPAAPVRLPGTLRLVSRTRPLRRVFSRFMAIGVRNEHVAAPPGRAYSSVVRAVHPFVARAVLGRAARILSTTTQGALR